MSLGRPRYRDRRQAGEVLAERLTAYANRPDVVVLALPRGGVPVGYEIARRLHAPLDVFLVRKIGVPGHEELGMGAVASGGLLVLNRGLVQSLGITEPVLREVVTKELRELDRREQRYRQGRPPPSLTGKTLILVDDGLATGSSMRAATEALRQLGPAKIVVAVPIAEPETCEEFRAEVDEVVCAATPEPFLSVGLWYEDFTQTSDAEVEELLHRAREELAGRTIRDPVQPADSREESTP